ncbi:HAD family hydrolase [Cyanobium sp. FGCU-6]|jgi:phosphoglycolate phosphatase|nr:HAD family hydrolase [Cyanobium sp. FGCU6]
MVHLLLRGESLGITSPPIDAILFDKDGTLSHSEPMLRALAEARVFHCLALAPEAGCPPEQHDLLHDLLKRAYGMREAGIHPAGTTAVAARDHNLISTATALTQVGLGWPESLALSEEVFALTDRLHGQGSDAPPQPTEGLVKLLATLREAGVRCGIISNDHLEGIHQFLGHHGLTPYFEAHWSAEHRPRKPDPGAVLGLCNELGVPPERCALIGDANSDLRMGRSAGVAIVLGYRAGWSQPVDLDPSFTHLDHWRDLDVVAGTPAGVLRA